MHILRKLPAVFVVVFILLLFAAPAKALDWVHDIEVGLEEASERNAPVFIFYCQET